jgi:hypothetical protein
MTLTRIAHIGFKRCHGVFETLPNSKVAVLSWNIVWAVVRPDFWRKKGILAIQANGILYDPQCRMTCGANDVS